MESACDICARVAARELSEEEKAQIVQSEKFSSFVNRTARYMERALATDTNIFLDYTGSESGRERCAPCFIGRFSCRLHLLVVSSEQSVLCSGVLCVHRAAHNGRNN